LNSITISLAVVAFVMGGALLGGYVRNRLPHHHLEGDTRDIVKAGIGLLATLSALVLGLIIASAKSSFDTKTEEVQTAAVKLLHLDRSLRQLGTVGDNARQELTQMVRMRVDQVWAQRDPMAIAMRGSDAKPNLETLQAAIRSIAPRDEVQRSAIARALQASDELAQVRALVIAHTGSGIIMPLLVVLVFWFTIITAGLNLFAPRNGTTLVFNILCALSIASAIFLVLEMDQSFGGMIHVSDAPLRAALAQLAR
jgi:hypothetical protein